MWLFRKINLQSDAVKEIFAWSLPSLVQAMLRTTGLKNYYWRFILLNNNDLSLVPTIIPWSGKYSLISTWLIADGNNFDSSYILCVTFVSQGGTAKQKELESWICFPDLYPQFKDHSIESISSFKLALCNLSLCTYVFVSMSIRLQDFYICIMYK